MTFILQMSIFAQVEEVIDLKGTRVKVRNTIVTTAANAPGTPLQNDIWFDTSTELTKIYDGSNWLTINLDALSNKEDSANKSTDTSLADATNTKFPTELAVKTYVDNQLTIASDDDITDVSFNGTDLTVEEGSTNFSADLSDLEESDDIAANTILINNHITADEDLSSTNEIQDAEEVNIDDTGSNFTATNVEGALTELANRNDLNLYSDDGTLSDNRAITQNNFDLNFDTNTLVISGDDNRVGIGTDSPDSNLDVNGNVKIRTLATGANTDNIVTADTDGNLRELPITSLETKTTISQNTTTGAITHHSEDGSMQTVNVVSTNANNSITTGTDGGAYFNNPIKAYGTLIPSSNSYTAIGISNAVKNGTGRYTFTMTSTRSTTTYPIQLSVLESSQGNINIYVTSQTLTTFSIAIIEEFGGTIPLDNYVDRTCYFTILDF
ncbi:autotransporter outer membrane beta-barrel domain-containing protein [Maribacter forsetii]|uniref:hypothetical protein n=1 Tax=Maribacter forsetii TaxID=444515 RepID=UPI000A94188D|nr:hypothetical protein [Maribacter forsetii]